EHGHKGDRQSFPTRRSSDLQDIRGGRLRLVRPRLCEPGPGPWGECGGHGGGPGEGAGGGDGRLPRDADGGGGEDRRLLRDADGRDRKSTRLNSSHVKISYAV